jgi:hypothetical protein
VKRIRFEKWQLPGQLVHGLEPLIDGLGEERGELLIVEDLQVATGRDLANLKKRDKMKMLKLKLNQSTNKFH